MMDNDKIMDHNPGPSDEESLHKFLCSSEKENRSHISSLSSPKLRYRRALSVISLQSRLDVAGIEISFPRSFPTPLPQHDSEGQNSHMEHSEPYLSIIKELQEPKFATPSFKAPIKHIPAIPSITAPPTNNPTEKQLQTDLHVKSTPVRNTQEVFVLESYPPRSSKSDQSHIHIQTPIKRNESTGQAVKTLPSMEMKTATSYYSTPSCRPDTPPIVRKLKRHKEFFEQLTLTVVSLDDEDEEEDEISPENKINDHEKTPAFIENVESEEPKQKPLETSNGLKTEHKEHDKQQASQLPTSHDAWLFGVVQKPTSKPVGNVFDHFSQPSLKSPSGVVLGLPIPSDTRRKDFSSSTPPDLPEKPHELSSKAFSIGTDKSDTKLVLNSPKTFKQRTLEKVSATGPSRSSHESNRDARTSSMPVPGTLRTSSKEVMIVNGKLYTVLNLLGKGGSSKVYQVYDSNRFIYAIKEVYLEDADESTRNGFKNEIELLRKMQNSEWVVKMYDYEYNESENKLLVVMEKGDTDMAALLRSITKLKPLSPIEIKYYWLQMLQAVADVHKTGIIHLDLKPANFLLVAGKVKLIDFGIASVVAKDVTSVIKDSQVGTLNFMSPESLFGQYGSSGSESDHDAKSVIKISAKSDVWSLGCILYNLVYGKTPFQHIRNMWRKMEAIKNPECHITFPPIKDQHLLSTLKACLRRDPKQRPSVEELLKHPYLKSPKAVPSPEQSDIPGLKNIIASMHSLTPRRIKTLSQVLEKLNTKR